MSNFDLDLSGMETLQGRLEELQDGLEDAPVFSVGTNLDYALSLEYGRGPVRADDGYLKFEVGGETIYRKEVSGHPPYPFFRPAIWAFEANPKRFIVENTDYHSIEEIPSVDALVRAAAAALTSQMEDNASAQSASDRSPGTHPDHPKRDSGQLVASISFTRVN